MSDNAFDGVLDTLNARIERARDEIEKREPKLLQALSRLAEEAQKAKERVEENESVDPRFVQEAHQDVVREVRSFTSLLEDYAVDHKSRDSLDSTEQ